MFDLYNLARDRSAVGPAAAQGGMMLPESHPIAFQPQPTSGTGPAMPNPAPASGTMRPSPFSAGSWLSWKHPQGGFPQGVK